MQILYLGITFAVIIIILAFRRPLYQAILGGLAVTAVLFQIPPMEMARRVSMGFTKRSSLSVLLSFYFITFLQRILEARSQIVLIWGITVVAMILTWLIPAGAFETESVDGVTKVIAGTYHTVEKTPVGPFLLVRSMIEGCQKGIKMMPGGAQLNNIIPSRYMGTSPMAAFPIGIACSVLCIAFLYLYFQYEFKKARDRGEHFDADEKILERISWFDDANWLDRLADYIETSKIWQLGRNCLEMN